jgi:hypothetical protein
MFHGKTRTWTFSISISNSPVTLHDGVGYAFPGFRDPDVLDFLFRPYCENGDWIAHEDS